MTHQSLGVLPGCLDGLEAVRSEVDDLEVVVVDNASTDGTVDLVRRASPRAVLVAGTRNVGYAAACNTGVRRRRLDGPVLLLNPDVRLQPGALTAMLDGLEDPGVGVVVPRLVDGEGRLLHSLRRDPTALRAWGSGLLGRRADAHRSLSEVVGDAASYAVGHDVEWATGAAVLMSAACLARVGQWDESFFLFSEETEFCQRVRAHGLRVRYVPQATAVHLGGSCHTDPVLWSVLTSNRVRLARRRLGPAAAASFTGAVLLGEALRALAGRPASRAALRALVQPSRLPPELARARLSGRS